MNVRMSQENPTQEQLVHLWDSVEHIISTPGIDSQLTGIPIIRLMPVLLS